MQAQHRTAPDHCAQRPQHEWGARLGPELPKGEERSTGEHFRRARRCPVERGLFPATPSPSCLEASVEINTVTWGKQFAVMGQEPPPPPLHLRSLLRAASRHATLGPLELTALSLPRPL